METERGLLASVLDNRPGAWEGFVNRYSKLVYFSIHHTFKLKCMESRDEDIEDIYGDVFLELFKNDFRKLRQFKGKNGCTLATWIRMIASRTALDRIRESIKREGIISADELVPDYSPDLKPGPEQSYTTKEEFALLEKAIHAMSVQDQLFFTLYYVRGMEPEDIAKALGVSVSTVYSKKTRLSSKLKKAIS